MSEEIFKHDYGMERVFASPGDIKNSHVTVMGLGLNGGGEAVVRFLLHHGAFLTVTDMKTENELYATLQRLEKDSSIDTKRITYVLGEHRIEDFENADCVIKNPGVKYDGNKYLSKAKYIETDLSLFLQFTNSPLIAVTGSKGKSSTASAIHYGLCKAGFNAKLGGNITVSPLSFIEECNEKTPIVIEFSSWQLADLRGRHLLKPRIAIITPIVKDHQNWYKGMTPYVDDKKLIYADQSGDDILLCSEKTTTDDWGSIFASEAPAHVQRYPQTPHATWLETISVKGEHQKQNVYNAYLVMKEMGISKEKAQAILQTYPGLEHRLECFHDWSNNKSKTVFSFYNDTTATVPEACIEAIKAFKAPVHLICGGTDKDLDFSELSKVLKNQKLSDIFILNGSGSDKLIKYLKKEKVSFNGPFKSLKEILLILKKNLLENNTQNKKEIILFSPGATSFGLFKNEFERGNQFKSLTKDLF